MPVSDGVQLTNRGNRPADGTPFRVAVQGWIQRPDEPTRDDFIDNVSDHCALVFTVQ